MKGYAILELELIFAGVLFSMKISIFVFSKYLCHKCIAMYENN